MTTATKYKTCSKYKPSQTEWLDQVPENWDEKRLKFLISQKITDGPHETPEFILEGVPFLSVDGIQDDRLVFEGCRYISPENHAQYKLKCFPLKGDVLLGKAASVGKVAIVDVDFEFNVWSPLALIRANKQVLPKYIYYSFKADTLQDQVLVFSTSNTQHNLSMDDIPELWLTFPDTDEQKKIVTFLDRETAKIDEMVAKKQKMIDLLKEKRQALITHAVTKGLNPKVKMKPSGIDWLGDIPEEWNIKRVRYVLDLVGGNGFPEDLQGRTEGEYPFYKVSDINGENLYLETSNNYVDHADIIENNWKMVPKGSIVTAKIGAALSLNHRKITKVDSLIDNNMLGLSVKSEKFDLMYVFYIFKIIDLDWFVNPGAVPSVNIGQFIDTFLPMPEIAEQHRIVNFIDREMAKIDEMVKKVEMQIEKLQEYRQALINNAVTGKIKI